ncbi:MAG: hypothetical protein Q9164_005252, partial [Protoblastenia rupestris]
MSSLDVSHPDSGAETGEITSATSNIENEALGMISDEIAHTDNNFTTINDAVHQDNK